MGNHGISDATLCRQSGRFRRWAWRILLLAGLGLGLVGPTVASGAAASHLSPVQQGLAFYRGKTLTIIVSATVGGPYDLYTRALQPYLSSYLHASVNIENISAGGAAPGENDMASAKPDGLTAGLLQLFTPMSQILTGQQVLNFNVDRLAWIAAMGPTPQILVAAPSSPYTTLSALVHSPAPVRIIASINTGLDGGLERALLGLLHVNAQFLSGYSAVTQEVVGLQRGDGPVTMLPIATVGPLLAGGQAVGLINTIVPSPGASYRAQVLHIPLYPAVFKRFPPRTPAEKADVAGLEYLASSPSGLLALQSGAAGAKVAALRAAVVWAFKQPGLRAQLATDGEDTAYIDPVQAKASFAASLRNTKGLACYVEQTC